MPTAQSNLPNLPPACDAKIHRTTWCMTIKRSTIADLPKEAVPPTF